MHCLSCYAEFSLEHRGTGLCSDCACYAEEFIGREEEKAEDAEEEVLEVDEEEAEGGRENVAGSEDKPGYSHRRLLEEDEAYHKAANNKVRGDPVDILKELVWHTDKPLIPGYSKRKRLWRIDLVAFFGFYGVERILGNSMALFLPKLLCFKHDSIYVSGSKLSAFRGLTSDWGMKAIKRLVRPWCLNCCRASTAKDRCAPREHEWQPPLFFKERIRKKRQRYYLTYLRPNMPAFASLILHTYDSWAEDAEAASQSDPSITTEERQAKYESQQQQAAHARKAKAEKAKASRQGRG